MTTVSGETYFPVSIISEVKEEKKSLSEKIKLEFSILHAEPKAYSIQVKLYDNQPLDFTLEIKQIFSEDKIIFEKFFVCDFYSKIFLAIIFPPQKLNFLPKKFSLNYFPLHKIFSRRF